MKLKTINLNLWNGGELFDDAVKFLVDQKADIVFLQEVYDGKEKDLVNRLKSVEVLNHKLDYPYFHFAPALIENIDNKKIIQGNLVLSKFPIKQENIFFYDYQFAQRIHDRAHFAQTPRNLQHVSISVNSKKVHLLNTQGIWGEDGDDNERRLMMAEKIVKEIEGLDLVILAGDFNVRPNTKTIQLIESKLKNVFKDELETSFNLKRKDLINYPGFVTAVVDMLFVSTSIKVLSHSCPQVDISDHLPLVAEIEV